MYPAQPNIHIFLIPSSLYQSILFAPVTQHSSILHILPTVLKPLYIANHTNSGPSACLGTTLRHPLEATIPAAFGPVTSTTNSGERLYPPSHVAISARPLPLSASQVLALLTRQPNDPCGGDKFPAHFTPALQIEALGWLCQLGRNKRGLTLLFILSPTQPSDHLLFPKSLLGARRRCGGVETLLQAYLTLFNFIYRIKSPFGRQRPCWASSSPPQPCSTSLPCSYRVFYLPRQCRHC